MQYYDRIRILRECNRLSKKAVANKLNISVNTYRDYETNRRRAPVSVIIGLARIYDCSVNYITGSSDIYGSFPEA